MPDYPYRNLPLWLRLSVLWGAVLMASRRLWWPLFGVHLNRAYVFWWADIAGDSVNEDSLDPRARKAVRLVMLQPRPSFAETSAAKIVPEFED